MSTAEQFRRVPLEALEPGTTLEYPVFDDRGDQDVLLVSGGATITHALLAKFRTRGITAIRVACDDLQQMGLLGEDTNLDDGELPQGISANSHWHNVKKHGAVTYDEETIAEFQESYQESLNQVGEFFDAISGSNIDDAEAVDAVSQQNISKLTEDLDLFITLGLGDDQDKYPSRHSLQTMMLASSIGTTMGLTKEQLEDLGIGCLLHDSGMLMINQRAWCRRGKLSELNRLEISKHPVKAFDRVNDMPTVPNGARMVTFQMHERVNGSGYPRGRSSTQIHPLSKIAMVADVFVALVTPRIHRPAVLPYQSMESIIKWTRHGLFDPQVVRALLKTVSLFPITSFVVMSDGRVGKVIRSNGESYTRPIVDLWHPSDTKADPDTVDLTEETELEVVRPLTQFEADQLELIKLPTKNENAAV